MRSYNNMKLWYLKNLEIFRSLPHREILRLHDIAVFKKYNKKEFIYFSEINLNNVYIIIEGYVVIGYLSAEGRNCSTDILTEGDLFGAIIEGGESHGYARSLGRTIVCKIDRNEFENILEKYPLLSLKIVKMLGNKINCLENKIQNLVFKDVKNRLYDLVQSLYGISQKIGSPQQTYSLSHEDIASLVGSTRETVSVNLFEMKKKGLIDYDRGRFRVICLKKRPAIET